MKLKFLLFSLAAIILLAAGGYFGARYYLLFSNPPEYFLVHPTIAKFFKVSPVCPSACAPSGICGKNGKNYCNVCLAMRDGTGYAYDGQCKILYTNAEYGFEMTFPATWKGFIMQKNIWKGWKTDGSGKIGDYSGTLLLFKNPQTKPGEKWQDISIMILTPDIWPLVSEPNGTVAVSAAPVGPKKIGENSKYVFATPPRWYGFTDDKGREEAVEIVKTFKAF